MHSTSADHERWLRDRSILVLHTRSVYGLRIPIDWLPEFSERVSAKVMAVPSLNHKVQGWALHSLHQRPGAFSGRRLHRSGLGQGG